MVGVGVGLARGSAWLAMAVSAVTALSGCGGDPSGTGIAGPAGRPAESGRHVHDASSDVTCGDDLRLDVIDNGASPRYPMVLDLPVGQHDLSHTSVNIVTSSEGSQFGGPVEKSPEITADLTADVASAVDKADGDSIQVTSRYENVVATGPVGPTIVDTLKDKVTELRFSPKGHMIEGDAGADPTERQLSSFLTPFPDEDMGAGAKWQAWRPLDAAGVQMCFLTTYELHEFDGKVYELTGDVKVNVLPGRSEQQRLGVTITVESRGGEGHGSMRNTGSLTEFSPSSGESTSTTKFTLVTSAPGVGEIVMTTHQKMDATFTRGDA